MDAISFNQQLCGAAWVHSKATKEEMFEGSLGSIPQAVCTRVFSPQSQPELKDAIDAFLTLSPNGDWSHGPHGPPGLPGPPRGRTPDEHLRLAVEFAESLNELEKSCFSLKGKLKDVHYHVSMHCLLLKREFDIAG